MKNLQNKKISNAHIVVKKNMYFIRLNKYYYKYLDNNDIYLFVWFKAILIKISILSQKLKFISKCYLSFSKYFSEK